MTCYWDSLYSQLNLDDYKFIGEEKPSNIEGLIRLLKNKNKYIDNVTWQKEYLSHNEKKEHFMAVNIYDIKGIRNGHLTSICDSFLLLVCEIFSISVEHRFLNIPIKYENLKKSRKLIKFTSNKGHFQSMGNIRKRSSQNRLERIRNSAIQNSQKKPPQNKPPQNKPPQKRPSWRSDPEGYQQWRQQMRTMNIR